MMKKRTRRRLFLSSVTLFVIATSAVVRAQTVTLVGGTGDDTATFTSEPDGTMFLCGGDDAHIQYDPVGSRGPGEMNCNHIPTVSSVIAGGNLVPDVLIVDTVDGMMTQRHSVYGYSNHPDLLADVLQTASGKTLTQDYVFSNTGAADTTIIFTVFSDLDLPYFGGPYTDLGQYTPPTMLQPWPTVSILDANHTVRAHVSSYSADAGATYQGFRVFQSTPGVASSDWSDHVENQVGFDPSLLNFYMIDDVVGTLDSEGITPCNWDTSILTQWELVIPAGGSLTFSIRMEFESTLPDPDAPTPDPGCPCGNDVIEGPEEQCDGTDDAACPGQCVAPGDAAECTCPNSCGNGIVDVGETCDPPGSPVGPNANPCRDDCTGCGDSVTQSGDGETCDDGNSAECDPAHPQRPAPGDSCNNICGGLICRDPSRIKLTNGLDVFKSHGVLVPVDGQSIDFSAGEVAIALTTAEGVIFATTLPSGSVAALSNGGFKYRDKGAKLHGGVHVLVAKPTKDGTLKLTVVSYGDIGQPATDMVTHLTVAGREWTVRGLWRQAGSGWVFQHATP